MKIAFKLMIALWCAVAGTAQAAFVVDTFTEDVGNQIGVFMPAPGGTDSVNVTDLNPALTVGGSRYYEITAVSGDGLVVARTENPFGNIHRFVYTSDANAIASGLLSYGRFSDLNANFDRGGLITGFLLAGFSADAPAQTGEMSLTVYSAEGVGTVTKSIADLILNPEFLHEEFDSGDNINFANVTRLDFSWGNFGTGGADFNINFGIRTVNFLPEPGTMSLMVLAFLIIMMVRIRTQGGHMPTPAMAPASGSARSTAYYPSTSDLYSLPDRSV